MVSLMRRIGFDIAFPQYLTAQAPTFPMASCQHAWQAVQIHLIMETGVRSLAQAVQTGGPVPEWAKGLPPPRPLLARPLKPHIPHYSACPNRPVYRSTWVVVQQGGKRWGFCDRLHPYRLGRLLLGACTGSPRLGGPLVHIRIG